MCYTYIRIQETNWSSTAFRTFKAPILIASSAGSRGWDVADVGHVINRDLPKVEYGGILEYVHRIGRTGRMGNIGRATSFYCEDDDGIAQDLVNCLIECECEVPEFLAYLVPEEGAINFGDDSDEEDADEGGNDNEVNGENGVDQVTDQLAGTGFEPDGSAGDSNADAGKGR
jgi:ATP-dependent RNA helicase DDX3X